jgi:predicted HTH domain antitoxin
MPLTITDEILAQTHFSEKELQLEIAVLFYKKQRFSIGQAARFAGISIFDMHAELAKRDIPLNISKEDVLQDWQTIQKAEKP